jgi:hypothetical protein
MQLSKSLRSRIGALGLAILGLAGMTAAASAGVPNPFTANVNLSCQSYTVVFTGKVMNPSDSYTVGYDFTIQGPNGNTEYKAFVPVTSIGSDGSFTVSSTKNWNPPLSPGKQTFLGGGAILVDITMNNQVVATTNISGSPVCFSCQGQCSVHSSNGSNFNGTPIQSGNWIWFNSNFTATGVPSNGTQLFITNQTITFNAGGKNYTLPVPNATITFSASATCTSTTFDVGSNTWVTTVPIQGDDEIWMSGLAFHVPSPFGQVTGNVVWSGNFSTTTPGVGGNWKWGAAVYSQFTNNYNELMVKAAHQTACNINNGDHAGTPEGTNTQGVPWQKWVIGGARGGGGSNFTGSWSGTIGFKPICPPGLSKQQ